MNFENPFAPGPARPFTGAVCLSLLMTFGFVACGDKATEESSEPAEEELSDVDALRALPYLGFSDSKVAAGRSGVVYYDPERASDGYTLYTHRNLCLAELIDMEGNVVKSWRHPSCSFWSNAELLENGDLVTAGMRQVMNPEDNEEFQRNAYVIRMSWDGSRVWETPITAHHDVDHRSDGKFVTLYAHWRRIPEWNRRIDVRDHGVAIISADGEIEEQKPMYEMLTSNPEVLELQKVKAAEVYGRKDIDLFHSNSVEWMHQEHLVGKHPIYDLDNVLISVRHQDTVAVVHWPTQKLVWAWGQGEISGPHDATVLPSGNVMIFDNGLSRRWSRVIEVDPQTDEIVWEYKAPNTSDFFTPSRGGNERLPNGNTLITNSDSAQVFEVTPEGEFVWEFFSPHTNDQDQRATIVRAHRYSREFIDAFLYPDGVPAEAEGKGDPIGDVR